MSHDTLPLLVFGFNFVYPKQNHSVFEYNYYYFKYLLPHFTICWVAGSNVGLGLNELYELYYEFKK